MKLVIDTNLWISYFFGKVVKGNLDLILNNSKFEILISPKLEKEIKTVLARTKFSKYISTAQIRELLIYLNARAIKIETTSNIKLIRDSKDNFLLNLSFDGKADYLITGDDDLLILGKYGKTHILTLSQFVKIIN
jgi:putative PIN family toxin of toxin-antitoxin system